MSSKFDFGARIKATSYDDLTGASGAQPSDAVKTIPIAKLHPFKMHPFKVLDNEDMEALTESVKENGILTPLTVRKDCGSDGYEIISGHRRGSEVFKESLQWCVDLGIKEYTVYAFSCENWSRTTKEVPVLNGND